MAKLAHAPKRRWVPTKGNAMKDLKSVSLVLLIAAVAGCLAFLAATASAGRKAALLEMKVAALEARLDADAAAKKKAITEAIQRESADPKSPLAHLINR
jgi:hypothetical protein